MNEGRSGKAKLAPMGQELRGVPYSITIGVPVKVQPGIDTELCPVSDGSPNSAPGLANRFALSVANAAVSEASVGRMTAEPVM